MIHSHPTLEQLTEFASGTLPLSVSLGLSGHLEYCPDCTAQVHKLQSVGASIMEQVTVPQSSDDDMSRLLAGIANRIDRSDESSAGNATVEVAAVTDININSSTSGYRLPKVLRQFVETDYNELNWVRLSPAFKIATLLKDTDGTQVALSRVKAGGAMPHHKHSGDEMTLVLEGSFSDESGVFTPGDFIMRDSRHKHHPIVTMDGECICLMVLDGPVQFTGTFTRWLNPLMRWQHSGI
jgi:putative transcriptional regulator